jgi:hypothetical protein
LVSSTDRGTPPLSPRSSYAHVSASAPSPRSFLRWPSWMTNFSIAA